VPLIAAWGSRLAMMRKRFGSPRDQVRQFLRESLCNSGMDLLASRAQQAGICGVLYQCMLEDVSRIGRLAANVNELRIGQLTQRFLELVVA